MLLWLYKHISIVCFRCFICFQSYVASVWTECFKSRFGQHMLQWPQWLADSSLPYCSWWGAAVGSLCGSLKLVLARAGRVRQVQRARFFLLRCGGVTILLLHNAADALLLHGDGTGRSRCVWTGAASRCLLWPDIRALALPLPIWPSVHFSRLTVLSER
jgi:hypothetical protein